MRITHLVSRATKQASMYPRVCAAAAGGAGGLFLISSAQLSVQSAAFRPLRPLHYKTHNALRSTDNRAVWERILSPEVALCESATLSSQVRFSSSGPSDDGDSAITTPRVVLYQYEVCPFCNKVRAYLDFKKISYSVVEVNPMSKAELDFTDYRKVPVALIDGKEVRDSTDIITTLSNLDSGGAENTAEPSSPEEEKWRNWVDGKLVHILPPNIYRTPSEALEAFEYLSEVTNFTTWQKMKAKYAGAIVMYVIANKNKKKYDIEDARISLYKAIDEWLEAVGDKDFLGGASPNLADVSVFGVIRSVAHLSTFNDLCENTKVEGWYSKMVDHVGESSRINSMS